MRATGFYGFTVTAICLAWLTPWFAFANDQVAKEVHLIEDTTRLIASNVRFSRFDPFKLDARERVLKRAEGKAVIIVVTNQRILGYGVLSGWRPLDLLAGEKANKISAEDFAGLVITNKRYLNFNGQSGVYGLQTRGVVR